MKAVPVTTCLKNDPPSASFSVTKPELKLIIDLLHLWAVSHNLKDGLVC